MLHLKTFRMRSIGWALFGVNFRPLQEIETIMGGGWIFDTGPFSRDYGICICNVNLSHTLSQCLATGMMQSLQNLTRLGVVGCVGNIENQQSHIDLV